MVLMLESNEQRQQAVKDWIVRTFGEGALKLHDRAWRILEEAMELAQAEGVTAADAHHLVDYVFARPIGEPRQEVGGIGVTLFGYAAAAGYPVMEAVDAEIERVLSKSTDHFRQRQAAKIAAGVEHPTLDAA